MPSHAPSTGRPLEHRYDAGPGDLAATGAGSGGSNRRLLRWTIVGFAGAAAPLRSAASAVHWAQRTDQETKV
jgi:hypothetical protein